MQQMLSLILLLPEILHFLLFSLGDSPSPRFSSYLFLPPTQLWGQGRPNMGEICVRGGREGREKESHVSLTHFFSLDPKEDLFFLSCELMKVDVAFFFFH